MPRWDYVREGWSPALKRWQHGSPGEVAALGLASLRASAELETRLGSASAIERRNATWAIGELRHPRRISRRATSQLIALLRDPDAGVRAAAAWTLGDLGEQRALPALRAMAAGETDPRALDTARRSVDALAAGLNLEFFRHR